MRNELFEYIPLKESEKNQLWDNCVFIFDTNILLNLYRHSIGASDELLEVFRTLSANIWLPHQVALEFMEKRCKTVFETEKKYTEFAKKIDSFLVNAKELSNLKDTDKRIIELKQTLHDWLSKSKHDNFRVIDVNNDIILEQVLTLFDGRTGCKYEDEHFADLCKSGKIRYAEKIPPGYRDAVKIDPNGADNNAYGDFILWSQILDYAKQNKRNVIFVTNDQKDDWWYILDNKTIGPRIELLREFRTTTGMQFHMYVMDSFFSYFNQKYDRTVKAEIIQEFKETYVIEDNYTDQDPSHDRDISNQIANLLEKIERSETALETLTSKYGKNAKKMPYKVAEQIINTNINITKLRQKVNALESERSSLSKWLDNSTSVS